MTNYIVRVYRQQPNNPHRLVGIVEEVGVDGRRGFTNIDELWDIFKQRSPKKFSTTSVKKTGGRTKRSQ